MNIKKPNQLRFYRLFDFTNIKFKIRFDGTLDKKKNVNGTLSIYELDSNVGSVVEGKNFEFKNDKITIYSKVENYIKRKIKNKDISDEIQMYLKENLSIN